MNKLRMLVASVITAATLALGFGGTAHATLSSCSGTYGSTNYSVRCLSYIADGGSSQVRAHATCMNTVGYQTNVVGQWVTVGHWSTAVCPSGLYHVVVGSGWREFR